MEHIDVFSAIKAIDNKNVEVEITLFYRIEKIYTKGSWFCLDDIKINGLFLKWARLCLGVEAKRIQSASKCYWIKDVAAS